ncbi:MAG TPA: hypothetical protein ENH35_00450 [Candidatus Moranbacteria bacterium]|nr:hypothetical protein [Candidatus Moranbacteria bacterium]
MNIIVDTRNIRCGTYVRIGFAARIKNAPVAVAVIRAVRYKAEKIVSVTFSPISSIAIIAIIAITARIFLNIFSSYIF